MTLDDVVYGRPFRPWHKEPSQKIAHHLKCGKKRLCLSSLWKKMHSYNVLFLIFNVILQIVTKNILWVNKFELRIAYVFAKFVCHTKPVYDFNQLLWHATNRIFHKSKQHTMYVIHMYLQKNNSMEKLVQVNIFRSAYSCIN